VFDKLKEWLERRNRRVNVDNNIEDYFWHLGQWEEWRYRVRPEDLGEARERTMDYHREEAIAAYKRVTEVSGPGDRKFAPNQNIYVGYGTVVYINCPHEDWKELFIVDKQPISKAGVCRQCSDVPV
jgi:hypothetical protein